MSSFQHKRARLNHAERERVRTQAERIDTNTMLLAKVVSFDPEKQQAKIKLQHMQYHPVPGSTKDEVQPVEYPELLEVPVMQTRGGKFDFTKPIKEGDGGMVIFASRSMDKYYKDDEIGEPESLRLHDLSDAVFVPGFEPEPRALAAYNNENFEIRNEAGDAKLEMSEAGKFALEGQSGEELFTILHELLGLLKSDKLIISYGSSAGSGHSLLFAGDYADLQDRLATIKLR